MCKHALPDIMIMLHYVRMYGICTDMDKFATGIKQISDTKSLIYGNFLHER